MAKSREYGAGVELNPGQNDMRGSDGCQWMHWVRPSQVVQMPDGGYRNLLGEQIADELLCYDDSGMIRVAERRTGH